MSQVLVVEDDPNIRKFVSINLRVRGFDVVEASTAEIGFFIIQQRAPDMLLLDLQLPGMSGLDLLKLLDGDRFDFPVVILSAWAHGQEYTLKTFHKQVVDVLTKPVGIEQLLLSVHEALWPDSRSQ
ncbi:MAG: response regulator [bacterium]|nr:response regulator [bacterium]